MFPSLRQRSIVRLGQWIQFLLELAGEVGDLNARLDEEEQDWHNPPD